jgi:amino acid transporter
MVDAIQGTRQLHKNAIGLSHIVFFVVAAAAPLTAVVGATPAAFGMGNGPGVPGTFVLAGGLYLLFSVGFTAMSRFVGSAGAFYTYISQGLGKPIGVAGALIALLAYNAVQIAHSLGCSWTAHCRRSVFTCRGGPIRFWRYWP